MAHTRTNTTNAMYSDHVKDNNNFSVLTICVPSGCERAMRRIIRPFLKESAICKRFLRVTDKTQHLQQSEGYAPSYVVSQDKMSTPCLTVMLFLPEDGLHRAANASRMFQEFPWKHHHTIELQTSNSASSMVVGKQEFYFLSRQMPLWSVCSSPWRHSRLRFHLFVRHYSAMVEFYRLVTGTEMETSKPGFCIFPLEFHESDPSSPSCELALKHSPHLEPFPLTKSYLTFPVSNINFLRTILTSYLRALSPRHYLVHDPDGNTVILHDVTDRNDDGSSLLPLPIGKPKEPIVDKVSVHSDSVDSGRFSDFDSCSTELEQCMNRLVMECSFGWENSPLCPTSGLSANEGKYRMPNRISYVDDDDDYDVDSGNERSQDSRKQKVKIGVLESISQRCKSSNGKSS